MNELFGWAAILFAGLFGVSLIIKALKWEPPKEINNYHD